MVALILRSDSMIKSRKNSESIMASQSFGLEERSITVNKCAAKAMGDMGVNVYTSGSAISSIIRRIYTMPISSTR